MGFYCSYMVDLLVRVLARVSDRVPEMLRRFCLARDILNCLLGECRMLRRACAVFAVFSITSLHVIGRRSQHARYGRAVGTSHRNRSYSTISAAGD